MHAESGKGWEGCKTYCKPDATFSAQSEPLTGVTTLQQYTDWMQALLTFIPDGRYELKSFGTDKSRKSVCAFAVFSGTHSADGGPCPPTGKSVKTDYVYVMEFDGDKIRAHDQDLAFWTGNERARLGLIAPFSSPFVSLRQRLGRQDVFNAA